MAITTNYKARSDAVPLRSFRAKGRPSAIASISEFGNPSAFEEQTKRRAAFMIG